MDELTHPDDHIWLSGQKMYLARTREPYGLASCRLDPPHDRGSGLFRSRDAAVRTLRAGDTVVTPAGEWHWQGASTTAMMSMLSVQGADVADGVVY